jgi:O-antigen/teichoic acid export membrane protein
MSTSKFVTSSLTLFLDQLLVAGGNWFYWLIISRIATTNEIGQATTIYNLIVLFAIITELGLEYPILKGSSTHLYQIFGTSLIIISVTTVIAIPMIFYLINNIYEESFRIYVWITIAIFILFSQCFVPRFALLGISAVRSILVIDSIGTCVRFTVAYVLIVAGYGTLGLLLSLLVQFLFIAAVSLSLAYKTFGFSIGKIKYAKEVFRDAIVNMPSKLSWMLVFSLSTSLLAPFGVETSEIGVFYIILMVSFVAGGLVSSMAQMNIPTSAVSKIDQSSNSTRIGMILTSPLIVALTVSPKSILLNLGTQYLSAETILLILAIGIFPFSIVINTISKFNYLGQSIKVLFIGSIQISAFFVSFLIFAPLYGTLGAAISILIGYIASSIPSMIWSERALRLYIVNFGIALLLSCVLGRVLDLLVGNYINPIVTILTSVIILFIVSIVLKNTSISEIREVLKTVVNTRAKNNPID